MRHPKTLAERAFDKGKLQRPTDWMPNGCGPAAGGRLSDILVPDELADVEFGHECCDPHDFAYAQGGFWGLFYRKPRADIGLGACVTHRFYDAAKVRWRRGGWAGRLKGVGTAAIGTVAGPLYTISVLAVGWLPVIWRWRKQEIPADALEAFRAASSTNGTPE